MINNLDDAPRDIKKTLLEEFKRYGLDKSGKLKSESEIKSSLQEYTGYILKMAWQGRYDKMSTESRAAMNWLTENFIREDLKPSFKHPKVHEVIFQGEDHAELAKEVIDNLYHIYKNTPELNFPQEKKSFFKRIFK